jgi:alkanesulfonate monooxygenase SsuD/methylene tetrahydromethanopterin reductase-like flavin-dependent oxidoreductase (luciferase family)
VAFIGLRYDFRNRPSGPTPTGELYRTCLDQCEWGDQLGLDYAVISEHHGAEDGFLPAPLAYAGAIAGRTRRLGITIAALLLPLHDPVRVAEDLAVLDLTSGGRITTVIGAGYRPEEFQMAGIAKADRGQLVEEYVGVLRQAWTGEPFQWRGRTIQVLPVPASTPHPLLLLGGSSVAAARRAARLRVGFFPPVADPELAAVYERECEAAGYRHGFVSLPSGPGFVHVSDEPERDWERLAPYVLYDAGVYHSWQTPDIRSSVHVESPDLDGIKASGVYRVVTPDECVALADELGPRGAITLHPLLAGMPPELGWESLELFASDVLPRLSGSSTAAIPKLDPDLVDRTDRFHDAAATTAAERETTDGQA